MAVIRLKCFWGAIDITLTDEQVYTAPQVKSLGTSAAATGGIGVRRCQLVFSRIPASGVEGTAVTTIDFLNLTGGNPDDTWVDADFTTLEGHLDTFWGVCKAYAPAYTTLDQLRWYRIGLGVGHPNPPVRITDRNVSGTGTGSSMPQQAVSVTEKTPVRRAWGRMYLPLNTYSMFDTSGRIASSVSGTIAAAAGTLYSAAAAAEYVPVVYSRKRSKTFSVESIQVDDLADVIRSRRWANPVTRSTASVG